MRTRSATDSCCRPLGTPISGVSGSWCSMSIRCCPLPAAYAPHSTRSRTASQDVASRSPGLFKTSRYELPSPQRRTAVEMLKMLLVEAMKTPIAASNTSDERDNLERGDDQDHR